MIALARFRTAQIKYDRQPMFWTATGVISTTRKFPRKSAAAASAAPLARILSGRISGGYYVLCQYQFPHALMPNTLTTHTVAIHPHVKQPSNRNTNTTAAIPGPLAPAPPPIAIIIASRTRTVHIPIPMLMKRKRRPIRSIVYHVTKEARMYQTCKKQPMSKAIWLEKFRESLKRVGA